MTDTHELKTWPEWYEPSLTDQKPWEIRKHDRDYKVGDILHLMEYEPQRSGFPGFYTGRSIKRRITYILEGGKFGVEAGTSILSLGPIFERCDDKTGQA